jgi:hypothetical protein
MESTLLLPLKELTAQSQNLLYNLLTEMLSTHFYYSLLRGLWANWSKITTQAPDLPNVGSFFYDLIEEGVSQTKQANLQSVESL